MIEETKYEKLFSTPLFSFEVKGCEPVNKALLKAGRELQARDEGTDKSNKGGWHSTGNLFKEPEPCFSMLSVFAETVVRAATARVSKVDPDTLNLKTFAWMNINPPGAFNAPHSRHSCAQPFIPEFENNRLWSECTSAIRRIRPR